MKKKKQRSYSLEDKLSAIQMYDLGFSSIAVSRKLGYSETRVKYWVSQYRANGVEGLKRPSFQHYPVDFKMRVVQDILENFLPFDNAAMKYSISPSAAICWTNIVKEAGYDALKKQKRQGRPRKDMGRPKKETPQTPIEKLQEELSLLKAENAYLKKLRALVEERIVRESGKLSKSSKD